MVFVLGVKNTSHMCDACPCIFCVVDDRYVTVQPTPNCLKGNSMLNNNAQLNALDEHKDKGELVASMRGRLISVKTTALRTETVYGETEKPPVRGQPFTVIAPALEGEGIRVVTTSDVTEVTHCLTDRSYQFKTRSGSEYQWDIIG